MPRRRTAAAPVAADEPTPDNSEPPVAAAAPAAPAAALAPETPAKAPRAGSKMAALVAALRGPDGATIERMQAITGWQEHSVRGALAGALKKTFGQTITSTREEGRGRVYRATPDAPA